MVQRGVDADNRALSSAFIGLVIYMYVPKHARECLVVFKCSCGQK